MSNNVLVSRKSKGPWIHEQRGATIADPPLLDHPSCLPFFLRSQNKAEGSLVQEGVLVGRSPCPEHFGFGCIRMSIPFPLLVLSNCVDRKSLIFAIPARQIDGAC